MGAKHIDFLVPNRFKHGYGLSPEIVQEAKTDKDPNLIITVDNGISSNEGAALARSFDIDVIITDHHLPPKVLPEANSIINPNLRGCDFPSKNLAGVGVCFQR
jgi:single-stranded-DNA-specific exonuclease